jgi:hypothetical protein
MQANVVFPTTGYQGRYLPQYLNGFLSFFKVLVIFKFIQVRYQSRFRYKIDNQIDGFSVVDL